MVALLIFKISGSINAAFAPNVAKIWLISCCIARYLESRVSWSELMLA